jgi:hypothetical protein
MRTSASVRSENEAGDVLVLFTDAIVKEDRIVCGTCGALLAKRHKDSLEIKCRNHRKIGGKNLYCNTINKTIL